MSGYSSRTQHDGHHLTDWQQIHQTLHEYALAVDLKQPAKFEDIFAADAKADYSGPLSDLNGRQAVTNGIFAAVAKLHTQHQLGTTAINIKSASTAGATTYFTAFLFGTENNSGKQVTMYGYYDDTLEKVEGQGWRVKSRNLISLGPPSGDLSLLQSP